jgi:hypothetical protein
LGTGSEDRLPIDPGNGSDGAIRGDRLREWLSREAAKNVENERSLVGTGS